MFEFIGGLNGDDYCPYDEDGVYIPGEDGENYITHTRRSTKCHRVRFDALYGGKNGKAGC